MKDTRFSELTLDAHISNSNSLRAMNEQQLLAIALTVALIGLTSLFFFEELPRQEEIGTLTWSNETAALILTKQPVWVELTAPTSLSPGACVRIYGHEENGRFTNSEIALAGRQNYQNCP